MIWDIVHNDYLPLSLSGPREDLSWLFTVRIWGSWRENRQKCRGHMQPPTLCQNYHLHVPTSLTLTDGEISAMTLRICLSLKISRWQFALWLKFFNVWEKSFIFWEKSLIFSLFGFFLLQVQLWKHLRSSHVKADTRSSEILRQAFIVWEVAYGRRYKLHTVFACFGYKITVNKNWKGSYSL